MEFVAEQSTDREIDLLYRMTFRTVFLYGKGGFPVMASSA
jgi:hypothetical protein